jgi:hypothetical protein
VGVKKTQKRFDIYNMMNPGVSVVLNISGLIHAILRPHGGGVIVA